jgi:WD40 repeat protein
VGARDQSLEETPFLPELNDEADDLFTLHLVARDEILKGESSRSTDHLPPLSETLLAELQSATACLDLLHVLRPHWKSAPTHSASWADATSALPPREFGRFELRKIVGRGGFGIVFLAFDPLLDREVALKLPRPDCLMTSELRRRFLREGHAAAALEHANIVTVYEAGEINGVCYLASSYCPGPTLAEWLRAQQLPVPVALAARLAADLADGVEHAHQRGVLHRDLKPANVLLANAGDVINGTDGTDRTDRSHPSHPSHLSHMLVPKITDFGLAKVREHPSDETRSGLLLGTPQYMAPEQARGEVRELGPACDIHALGVILYEMLVQRKPFDAGTDVEVLRKIAQDEPVPPRRCRQEIPRDLQSVCLKCLEKEPARRYVKAGELAADLRRFLRGEPVLARSASALELAVRWARRRPAVAALAAVCLLGVLGLLGLGAWHYHAIEKKNVDLQSALDDAEAQREHLRRVTYGIHTRLISALWQDGQTSQMAELLSDLNPREGEEDLREFAWHYLRRQAENEVWLKSTRRGTRTAAFSRDGRTLATVHDDYSIMLWDLVTRRYRRVIQEQDYQPVSVSVSPKADWVAACGNHPGRRDFQVIVWNGETGEVRGGPKHGKLYEPSLAFSPDGHWLALASGVVTPQQPNSIILWDPATTEQRGLVPQLYLAKAVAFLPDGKTLVTTGEPRPHGEVLVLLIDVATGRELRRLTGFAHLVNRLAVSPDGRFLATGTMRGLVQAWDLKTGKETHHFQEGHGEIRNFAFLHDSGVLATKAAATQKNSEVFRLRDLVTGEVRENPYPVPGDAFGFVSDATGRRLAFRSPDDIIRVWQPYPPPPVLTLPAHEKEVWAVAFAPDGRTLASASDDHAIKLWDTDTLKERITLKVHGELVTSLAYGPNGLLASGSFDKKVRLWDGITGKALACWEGHTVKIYAVAFSPDGSQVASGGDDETVRLWDVKTGEAVKTLHTPGHGVRALAFSPDGRSLAATGGHGLLIAWDTATWKIKQKWRDAGDFLTVAFLRDNKTVVTGGEDSKVRFWEPEGEGSAAKRKVLGGHYNGVYTVIVSPDGRTLATGGMDRTVRLWHEATGQELICFKDLPARVNSLAFSPDGKSLAAALHDGKVLVWRSGAAR